MPRKMAGSTHLTVIVQRHNHAHVGELSLLAHDPDPCELAHRPVC